MAKKRTKFATKAEVRVVIAKDVIAQLRTGKLTARSGTYCEFVGPSIEQGKRRSYTACALGAVFVAKLDRFNKLNLDVATHVYGEGADADGEVDLDQMRAYLCKTFTERQTAMIETAFEAGQHGANCTLSYRDFRTSSAFGFQVARASARLEAIMRNIIKNDGQFVPPPVMP